MEHTKEPWVLMAAGDEVERQVIVADRTSLLTIVYEDETAFAAVYSDADARRIVACVNACVGIPTDDLETIEMPIAEAMKAASVVLGELERIEAQRNELLAALYEALPYVECAEDDPAYKPGSVAKVVNGVRDAIAKAEQL